MNSRSELDSLMEKNKPLLQEAAHPITLIQITEQTWLAVVGLLQNLTESQDTMRKMLSKNMTATQMQSFVQKMTETAVQNQNACTEIQEQIKTETSSAMTDLLSQAGSLKEECCSMLKQQEESSQKARIKFMKILIASQSALLILSTVLQHLL